MPRTARAAGATCRAGTPAALTMQAATHMITRIWGGQPARAGDRSPAAWPAGRQLGRRRTNRNPARLLTSPGRTP